MSGAERMAQVEDNLSVLNNQVLGLLEINIELISIVQTMNEALTESMTATSVASPAARWALCKPLVAKLKSLL